MYFFMVFAHNIIAEVYLRNRRWKLCLAKMQTKLQRRVAITHQKVQTQNQELNHLVNQEHLQAQVQQRTKQKTANSFQNHWGIILNKKAPSIAWSFFVIKKSTQGGKWRYHPDLNRGIKVLQTFALPLGHGTKDLIMLSKKTTLVNNLYAIKQKRETDFCFSFVWSGRRDSNSRPLPWQGNALPLSHSRRWWEL